MLTAQTQLVALRTPAGDRVIAGILAASLLAVLVQAAFSIESWQKSGQGVATAPTATPLGMALVGVRVDQVEEENLVRPKSGYLLPFEIVSVHLLVVLVGAAYLARAKRRRVPRSVDLVASTDSTKPMPSVAASSTLVAGGPK
jgi:NADH-quinone oxidoreductase subunit J